jgi:1-acyl-sn-glycerol-3-phosphate acyltransferase
LVYRFKVQGDEHMPVHGAAVLVCNHVSFVDAVLLMAASPRPIRFIMDHRIFKVPVLGWIVPPGQGHSHRAAEGRPATYEAAFERAAQVLREGDLLAIFPEGGITRDGQLQPFKGGIMKILERARPTAGRARGSDGADQPVGLVLQPHRAGRRHGAAVPARPVQPRGAERGLGYCYGLDERCRSGSTEFSTRAFDAGLRLPFEAHSIDHALRTISSRPR